MTKYIFWVRDSFRRHTIVSLELAESLIRREVFGLGLSGTVTAVRNEQVKVALDSDGGRETFYENGDYERN